jgi:hypothetical protein
LKDIVRHLRFPLLSAEEFNFEVLEKGMLEDPEVIAMLKHYSLAGMTR